MASIAREDSSAGIHARALTAAAPSGRCNRTLRVLTLHSALGHASFQAVQLAQDLDCLAAEVAVHGAPVVPGHLAHLAVELGVADLAVLRLLGGAQLGEPGLVTELVLAAAPERRRHERADDEGQ